MTYPRDISWQEEALLHAQIARDYGELSEECAVIAEEAFAAQAEAVATGIREFYEGGVAPLPDGVVPERVEVTAVYGTCPGCGEPWPCTEVRKSSKEWEEG
jgi:hypothetical protein